MTKRPLEADRGRRSAKATREAVLLLLHVEDLDTQVSFEPTRWRDGSLDRGNQSA